MKKLVLFLITVSFISFLSFENAFARENRSTATAQYSDTIGINLKGFAGFGFAEIETPLTYEETNTNMPQFVVGINYVVSNYIPFELGVCFHYNKYEKINDYSIIKGGIEALFSGPIVPRLEGYISIDFFPYVKVTSDVLSSTTMALSFNPGLKYNLNSHFSLLTQISYETFFKKDDVSIESYNFLFGIGITI